MTWYCGGEEVTPGLYVEPRHLSFHLMTQEERLPGGTRNAYLRVPMPLLILAAPLIGGLYLVILPILGLTMLLGSVGATVVDAILRAAVACIRVVAPTWEPARAFLARRKAAERDRKRKDAWAEETRKELGKDSDQAAR